MTKDLKSIDSLQRQTRGKQKYVFISFVNQLPAGFIDNYMIIGSGQVINIRALSKGVLYCYKLNSNLDLELESKKFKFGNDSLQKCFKQYVKKYWRQ